MIRYVELDGADFTLVELRDGKPWCKLHGAMNMVSKDGYWRCISQYRKKPDGGLIENACRAGCKEVKSDL